MLVNLDSMKYLIGPPIVSMCRNTRNNLADRISLMKWENFNFNNLIKLLLKLGVEVSSTEELLKNRITIQSISIVDTKSIKNQLLSYAIDMSL